MPTQPTLRPLSRLTCSPIEPASTHTTVTLSAVVARINRKLERERGTMLRKTRSQRAFYDLGDFYEIDISRNLIMSKFVDPEQRARELGVLGDREVVERG